MKNCPICEISPCSHEKKFLQFSLAKVILVERSVDSAVALFSLLKQFMPSSPDVSMKIANGFDALLRCQDNIKEVRKYCQSKLI